MIRSVDVVSFKVAVSLADQPRSLGAAVVRYGLARAAVVAAVTGVLVLIGAPLLVGLLVALVAAVPLSMLLFPRLRSELDAALATAGARRARLRAQLRGESVPLMGDELSDRLGQCQANGGADRPREHEDTGAAQHTDQSSTDGPAEHRADR